MLQNSAAIASGAIANGFESLWTRLPGEFRVATARAGPAAGAARVIVDSVAKERLDADQFRPIVYGSIGVSFGHLAMGNAQKKGPPGCRAAIWILQEETEGTEWRIRSATRTQKSTNWGLVDECRPMLWIGARSVPSRPRPPVAD